MNYGRKRAAKKRRDITSKSKMKKKRLGVRIFKGVLLALLLLVVAGCVGGGIFIKKVVDDAPDVTPEDVKPTGYTSVIYASDNKTETERLTSAGSTVFIKQSMRFQKIFSMLLSQSKTNVFMSIMESISKVSSVPD